MSIYYAIEFDSASKNRMNQKQVELKQNSESGSWSDKETFHITLFYVGKDIIDRKQYIDALDLFKEKFNPQSFDLTLQNFGFFDNSGNEGRVAWIGVKNSLPLYNINYQLKEILDQIDAPYEPNRFGGYTPHITMGYDVITKETLQTKFEDNTPINIKSVCLWDSFKANDTYITNKIYEISF